MKPIDNAIARSVREKEKELRLAINTFQKIAIVASFALGFMCATWDAMFFAGILLGNGSLTIFESNTVIAWLEFIGLIIISGFLLGMWAYWSKNIWKIK